MHRQSYFRHRRTILDLCGGTGSWSKPYRDAGYDVRVITLPDQDVRMYRPPEQVHGILAAPPCTAFSRAGGQYWDEKDADGRTQEGLSVVDACLRIVYATDPQWWCLENPIGRLKEWIGQPDAYFHPCDYGDPWTKQTCLWGRFTMPEPDPVEPEKWSAKGASIQADAPNTVSCPGWGGKDSLPENIQNILDGYDGKVTKKVIRSITPPGFAERFYESNP